MLGAVSVWLCFDTDRSEFTFTSPQTGKWKALLMIRVSFFGLTWSLLLGRKASSPDGSGGWREGQIFTKLRSWSKGPAEALAAAAVRHMAYSKTSTSELGVRVKDEKTGRESEIKDLNSVRSGWHPCVSEGWWLRRSNKRKERVKGNEKKAVRNKPSV